AGCSRCSALPRARRSARSSSRSATSARRRCVRASRRSRPRASGRRSPGCAARRGSRAPAFPPLGRRPPPPRPPPPRRPARRALAAAGGHNLLFVGPPGRGKTLLARRLPGILPPLDFSAALEATRIHSAAGTLARDALLAGPPFRAPHHSTSDAGMAGGGRPL